MFLFLISALNKINFGIFLTGVYDHERIPLFTFVYQRNIILGLYSLGLLFAVDFASIIISTDDV